MLRRNVSLAPRTTLRIGGPAEYYSEIANLAELEQAWTFAQNHGLPVFFLGDGSNVLFSDRGFRGLVIHNRLQGKEQEGREIRVGGGENLPAFIEWANLRGLAGMERMYGIPGTIAGAIVGNAGAYGQEISDVVRQVRVWRAGATRDLDASQLDFGYRHSRFKLERDKFIVSCILKLKKEDRDLQSESDEILRQRLRKYPAGLRCPGSFFKNVLHDDLPALVRQTLPPHFVMYGKVPAGKLLEAVGANGATEGGAGIASYHGNLLINRERATSRDILLLAQRFADRVYEKFGIVLEPEIRLARGTYFKRPGERKEDAGRDSTVPN